MRNEKLMLVDHQRGVYDRVCYSLLTRFSLPASEAQLPELQVDSIGLVTTCALGMGQEEVRLRTARQRDCPSADWDFVTTMALLLLSWSS